MARKTTQENRLRQLRTASGLGLNEVARQLGIDKGLLSRYERGEIAISAQRAEEFAAFYRCSPAHILGWDEPPFVQSNDNGDPIAEAV